MGTVKVKVPKKIYLPQDGVSINPGVQGSHSVHTKGSVFCFVFSRKSQTGSYLQHFDNSLTLDKFWKYDKDVYQLHWESCPHSEDKA